MNLLKSCLLGVLIFTHVRGLLHYCAVVEKQLRKLDFRRNGRITV